MRGAIGAPILLLIVALAATACGSDGEQATAPTTMPSTTMPSTTTAETTTTQPEPEPVAFDLATLPDLVDRWSADDESSLALAEDIIGFPLPVEPASRAATQDIEVRARESGDPTLRSWDWSYVTLAADPVGEIDIELDDMGEGSVALRNHYDPIMTGLGWSYSNSTGSDPSSGAGGPQSVNHVYVYDGDETMTLASGIDVAPDPAFVWADEDVTFDEGKPGYRINFNADASTGVIPVPVLDALVDALPVPDDAEISRMTLRSGTRPADSFDAEWGLRFLELEIDLSIPAESVAAAQELATTGLDGDVLQAGEDSFFDPGFIEPTEPIESAGRWSVDLLLLSRYPGSVSIEPDETSGDASVDIRFRFEPNRPELQQPAE